MWGDPDNHAAENTVPGAGTAKTSSATANSDLAHVLKAALVLAQFLGQMTQLNKNVNLLLGGQDKSEEDSETVSVEDSENPADMDTELSAILAKETTGSIADHKMGDALLQELAQDLTVSEKTSPLIHEGLAGIFNGL